MTASDSIGPEWILVKLFGSKGDKEHAALLDSARRVWPNLRSFARRTITGGMSSAEKDQFSAEVWEEVLSDAAKAVSDTRRPILNIEAYLTASFRYRLLRKAKREKKLRETIQFLPPKDLIDIEDVMGRTPNVSIEDRLEVEQITEHMDQWTLTVWNLLVYGMSWKEIAKAVEMEQEPAKQKFRYELKKIRMRLQRRSAPGKTHDF